MSDPVAKSVTRALVPNLPTVSGRVFRGTVAQLPDPVYPLVCFYRATPGRKEPRVPYVEGDLVFAFCSDKNYDEAWTLFRTADALLDNQCFTSDGTTIVLVRNFDGMESLDQTGKPVYRVFVRYNLTQVG